MDLRIVDEATQLKETIDRALSRMNTCIPGIVDSFDETKQTVVVRPAILGKTYIDGQESTIEFPQIINAPLIFPFAATAGFALTLPVRKGDPCIILFSQRAIDNWHDKGGVQPAEEGISSRHHDLTDALVMLTASPIPDVLGAWNTEGIEIRNRARNSRVTVLDDFVQVVKGPSSIVITDTTIIATTTDATIIADTLTVDAPISTFTGDVDIEGLLSAKANLDVTGTLTNNSVNTGSTHVHTQGPDSDNDTQVNTGVPQ